MIDLAYKKLVALAQDQHSNVINSAMRELAELMESSVWRPGALTQQARAELLDFRENPPSEVSDADIVALLETTHKVNSGTSRDSILQALLEATVRITDADRGAVFLPDSQGAFSLAAAATPYGALSARDIGIPPNVLRDVSSNPKPIFLQLSENDKDSRGESRLIIRNTVFFPIQMGKKGVLYLDTQRNTRKFASLSHDLLRNIMMCAEAAVDNIASTENQMQFARYEKEINIAHDVQRSLMPEVRELPYAKFECRCRPALALGADFVEAVETLRGLYVVVSDVSGKGFGGAVVSSALQGIVYAELKRDRALRDTATCLNRFLCDRPEIGRYATSVLILLCPNGEVELLNCGHQAPLLISGDSISSLGETGSFPIGLIPEAEFQPVNLRLTANDRILVVTDGVTEALDPNEELFGMKRLTECCKKGVAAIEEAVVTFSGRGLADDFSIAELTYLPSNAARGHKAASAPKS